MSRTAATNSPVSTFEAIAMPHLDAVYRTAYALSGRSDTADDLTQAALLKALEHFSSFQVNTNCKAWLLRILRNIWIDRLRRLKTAGPQLPLDEALVGEAPEIAESVWSDAHDLLENFSDEQVIKALAQLAVEQRLTLYLVDVEGLGHEEVAEITGVAVGTVKSRTSRARATLKKCLAARANEMGWAGERR
ncbi:MAG: RNA polymerase sigma factor [Phycisphaerae bacterium]|nr:RNA polymerase sigma factor [Phycisphaerae bacterium]